MGMFEHLVTVADLGCLNDTLDISTLTASLQSSRHQLAIDRVHFFGRIAAIFVLSLLFTGVFLDINSLAVTDISVDLLSLIL